MTAFGYGRRSLATGASPARLVKVRCARLNRHAKPSREGQEQHLKRSRSVAVRPITRPSTVREQTMTLPRSSGTVLAVKPLLRSRNSVAWRLGRCSVDERPNQKSTSPSALVKQSTCGLHRIAEIDCGEYTVIVFSTPLGKISTAEYIGHFFPVSDWERVRTNSVEYPANQARKQHAVSLASGRQPSG